MDLRDLDDEELSYELCGSKEFLEQKLGQPVKYVSFPFGRFNKRVVQFSKKADLSAVSDWPEPIMILY
jgi:peptidoglycan/xylan/chitin deacetylase (PgdA/CDA1 family)